jgi:hypothetical protein
VFAARRQEPDPPPPNPPPTVRRRVPTGGISVRWQAVNLAGQTLWLHQYVVPKGRNKYRLEELPPAERAKPLTAGDILRGEQLEPSPFTVELYAAPDAPAPLHAVTFRDECFPAEIFVKYLRPAEKKGPILLLNGGYTHWRSWTLILLPEGVGGKRALVQRFLWGAEGGTGVEQKFEKTDPKGYLQVDQTAYELGQPDKRTTFRWDGYRFVDPAARWFVLGAVSKRRADAEAFVQKNRATDYAEIIETSRFPRLAPGLYAVVLARCRTSKEASEEAKRFKQIGVECYVKQAF